MKSLSLIFFAFSLFANVEKGEQIARDMDAANKGYGSESSVMELVLIDSSGTTLVRGMKGTNLEKKEVIKGLMTFLKPNDVKGTKLLTWSYRETDKDDDQWLFLPSLKRVKKINSRTRGSSFMGSEFSYADLTAQTIEKYNFSYVKDIKVNGHDTWMLNRVSKYKSNYKRVEIFVSKKMLTTVASNYYNKRNELYKKATFKNFKKYKVNNKEFFRASEVTMSNLQNGKKSKFVWSERRLGEDVKESDLHKRSLR